MAWYDDFITSDLADDVLGLDPNGGGIWDPETGLLKGVPDEWKDPLNSAITNYVNKELGVGVNPVTNTPYYDTLGDIDITAPGSTVTEGSNPFYDVTGGYTQPIVEAATDLYNEGPTDLNPLQKSYYDAMAAYTQPDEYGKRLAAQAASAAGAPFAAAGTFGGRRHSDASTTAAADVIADRERERLADLKAAGDDYYNWQSTRDWDWLNKYKDTIGYGDHVPTSSTSVEYPSGPDIYNAELGKKLIEKSLNDGSVPGITPDTPTTSSNNTPVQGTDGNWYDPITNEVVKAATDYVTENAGDWLDTAGDWLGLWAQGGEIPMRRTMPMQKKDPYDDWF